MQIHEVRAAGYRSLRGIRFPVGALTVFVGANGVGKTTSIAPLRQPCLAVTTPTLASDASDLAAVFATLVHIREEKSDLDRIIDDAFPGATLVVPPPERMASFGLVMPDYPKRVFEAGELSDGTLRYLALAGALFGYRLPAFIA